MKFYLENNIMNIFKYVLMFITVILCTLFMYIMYVQLLLQTRQGNIFEKIYLINLKRRPDRLLNFNKFYGKSDLKNVPITKFDAIDGSKLDVSMIPLTELARSELTQLETTGFRTKHYQLTKGAIGCYLSHVKVWEHILKNSADSVLIFEDDAKVPPNLKRDINEKMHNVPKDWDIVLFGFICTKCMKYSEYSRVDRFMLTHCYLIRKQAIIKMMDTNSLFPITQQIDWMMSEMSSILNIYTVNDKLVTPFESRTDIQAPLRDKRDKNVYDKPHIKL
jgi:GR25 family glycosyltransferase involved in LPS biosynthesis